MNLYIMADSEGISGIYSREQVMGDRIPEGRVLMTEDINVCADAAKEAGVEKIYVRDCHGGANTVIYDKISENVDYVISGHLPAGERYPGIEDCDAIILLGYHAMAGTYGGVLEHTFSSANIQNYWLNGKKIGEAELDTLIASEFGKPVIMVSGDDKLCAEVKGFMPDVVACEVKKGMTWRGAMLLSKQKAHAKIAECTKEAIAKFRDIPLYKLSAPYTLRVELVERGVLPRMIDPRIKLIDGRTYEITANTIAELFALR